MAFKLEPGADQKTPPAEVIQRPTESPPGDVFFTAQEVTTVKRSVRIFAKGFVPFLPKIAASAGPAVAVLILATIQHCVGKAEVEQKVDDAKETTERAYTAATDPQYEVAAEVKALEARVTAAEATNAAQSALLVAQERDFVIKGSPAKAARRRRVDPVLVKAVQANAVKDSKELAERSAKPSPEIALPPLKIPPPPPPKDAQPAAATPSPPAPVQPQDASPATPRKDSAP